MYVEKREVKDLDKEMEGARKDFLKKLKYFQEKFPLKADFGELPPLPPELPADAGTLYLGTG